MHRKKPGKRRRAGRILLRPGVQIATAAVHGDLLEVSRAGLSFSCRESDDQGLVGPEGAILFGSGHLYVSACLIVPVWEEKLAEAATGGVRCRCGVRFLDLSPGQERDLGRLIRAEARLSLVSAPAGSAGREEPSGRGNTGPAPAGP